MLDSWRWNAAKVLWISGQWLYAILLILNGFPNMTYPGGEAAYDAQCAQYEAQYGSADDFRAWKIVAWREMWHTVGGLTLGLLNLPALLFLPLWATFILPSLIFIAFLYKEIFLDGFQDRGHLMPKDFLDATMWAVGMFFWVFLRILL